MINLQYDTDLRNIFRNVRLHNVYKLILHADTFPVLCDKARRMTRLFGRTYICEQFSTEMKALKIKPRNRHEDENWKAAFTLLHLTYIHTLRT